MILPDHVLEDRIIQDPDTIEEACKWWLKDEWDKIGKRIVIDPFNSQNLAGCTYGLCVGAEYISLRNPEEKVPLGKGKLIEVGPGETVLVLTENYVCLPRDILAMVVPRARRIFEGSSICTTRIDPTWYGKLVIGFTNLNKFPTCLWRGEEFCSCYFVEVGQVIRTCKELRVPGLGRTEIGKIVMGNIVRQRRLLSPEEVTRRHMNEVVEDYGPPYDIIRGAIELSTKEIKDYVSAEIAPDIAERAASEAVRRGYDSLIKLTWVLVGGILAFLAGLFTAMATGVFGMG